MEKNFPYKWFLASPPAEDNIDACHGRWPTTFDKNNLQHFLKMFLYSDFINGSLTLALQSVPYDRASQRMNMPLNDQAEAWSASGVPVLLQKQKPCMLDCFVYFVRSGTGWKYSLCHHINWWNTLQLCENHRSLVKHLQKIFIPSSFMKNHHYCK